MEDYKNYLADQVLSEDKIVTYRTLSRALNVNVNVAKQMLFEFHGSQNKKRAGAVHATYMIYGTQKIAHANGHAHHHDDDVEMTSSPPEPVSVAEEVPMITLSLVAEETLGEVLSAYEKVTSIHVYSLGPHPVKDLQLLADVSKPIIDNLDENESADPSKALGPIRNPYVRRRDRRPAAPKPAAPPSKVAKAVDVKTALAAAPNPQEGPKAEQKPSSKPSSKPESKESTPVPSGTKKTSKPAPKRGASGGIMQSFAKAAAKPKKADTPQPAEPSAAEEDSSMPAMSDDGEDDSVAMPEPKGESEEARKSRKQRQDDLKRMMEESSEDEEPEKEDTPMEEPEEEAPAPEPEKKEDAGPAEVIASTGDGRRRGKRRVMTKKTVMDDQGYLVTVQEPGWESFSEDEPVAPPKKKAETASQPAKSKKAGPKGQGNIMSFFSKK